MREPKSKLNSLQVKIGALCLFLLIISLISLVILINLTWNLFDSRAAQLILCIAIAVIIPVILGYLISGRWIKRLRAIADSADGILDGDFTKKISDSSTDEIGELAHSVNALRLEWNKSLEEISNEQNKLETIMAHLTSGVIMVDLKNKITHANPAARTMFRISNHEIKMATYDEIISKYSDEMILENLIKKSELGAASENFMYGGATFSVRFDKFKDEFGRPEGIIIIIEDVTEQNKIESMQVDFIANISHELKTPLTTIKSYTETLIDDKVSNRDTALDFLNIIDSEVDRMNRMVKDLLQLSRLDYKQQKWYKKQEELVSIVRTAIKKMDMTAKSKELQVNQLFDKDLIVHVDIDRDRIEQVILNILSNAIKYTNEKGRIDIDIIKKEESVQIIIADNGMGIPEKQLSRVFERFFRVDKARSRMMGGTGLGLSISKQIVEEHKGSISIDSKLGQGTIVTVSLPLAPMRGRRGIE